MATFLVKTEPGEYSFAQLVQQKRCMWSGVSNNTALLHLRTMRKGDDVLVYHTGDERAVVGLARVAGAPYEDPQRPGLNAKGEPKFAVVDMTAVKAAKTPVPLMRIKDDAKFKNFALVTQGRLSVMPVEEPLAAVLREWAGL
ncbi:MAG: EVE domain-containing protein [Planctomycetes bacterium]|nr:EVE domain-containing protein [Planctomycetota bacterium]